MRIFYVPIEPLEERYTASWYRNIPKFFSTWGAEVTVIDGKPLADVVETGTFLDINSTIHYKCSQMQEIARLFRKKEIRNGDVFFFGDIEFWGLESLRLMSQINGIDVFICGVLHAASYSTEDTFSVAAEYQQYTEMGWLGACDKVFVGSQYHLEAITERRLNPLLHGSAANWYRKIIVTGLPLFKDDYAKYDVPKKNQIIIAGRFDWEKRPNLSLDFAYLLYKKLGVRTVVTISGKDFRSNRSWLVDYARYLEQDGVIKVYSGLGKEDYHRHLAESKVLLLNTVEENFGYCPLEACIYGCVPIVPNKFSLPEILGRDIRLLFEIEDEIVPMVRAVTELAAGVALQALRKYPEKYYKSMDRIWEQMTVMVNEGRV